jgi:hypothetical protein
MHAIKNELVLLRRRDGDCSANTAQVRLLLTASVVWWLACWPPEIAGSIQTEAVGFFPM